MNEFLDKCRANEIASDSVFEELYYGEHGEVLDPLSELDCDGLHVIFPRLEKILRTKKQDLSTYLPICTNFIHPVSRDVVYFSIGSGIDYYWLEDQGDSTVVFDEFWKKSEMSLKFISMMQYAVAVGYSGLYLQWSDGDYEFQQFKHDEYHEDEFGNSYLYRSYWDDEKLNEYIYVISYVKSEGEWFVRHQMFEHDIMKKNHLGRERKDILRELPLENLEDGYEPRAYKEKPILVFHNPNQRRSRYGASLFQHAVGHIQALWFNEIMAEIELQTNLLSKMAVEDASSGFHVETGEAFDFLSQSIIDVPAGSKMPQYIQKHVTEILGMLQYQDRKLRIDLANMVGVPPEMIPQKDESNNAVRVEAIKTQKAPFDNFVRGFQSRAGLFFDKFVRLFMELENVSVVPKYNIHFRSVFGENQGDINALREDRKSGDIGQRMYLSLRFPEWNQQMIDAVIKESNKERDNKKSELIEIESAFDKSSFSGTAKKIIDTI